MSCMSEITVHLVNNNKKNLHVMKYIGYSQSAPITVAGLLWLSPSPLCLTCAALLISLTCNSSAQLLKLQTLRESLPHCLMCLCVLACRMYQRLVTWLPVFWPCQYLTCSHCGLLENLPALFPDYRLSWFCTCLFEGIKHGSPICCVAPETSPQTLTIL